MDRRTRKLLRWFARAKRDLPWRRTPDPYPIWISEVMLQQTRVETVVPYFERWMKRFPDVATLAAADEAAVLKAWEGLGYYSRARNVHRAAKLLHDGGFPRTAAGLAQLPGFGPYTSASVAAIAFGEPVLAVDGNVRRVAARLFATADEAEAVAGLRPLVPEVEVRAFTEALMELGALVCAPRDPACDRCPLRADCLARREGRVAELPPKRRRAPVRAVRVLAALCERDGRVLLERRDRGLHAGLWALPWVEEGEGSPERDLAERLRAIAGGEPVVGPAVARLRWAFTHRVWDLEIRQVRGVGGRRGEWVERARLAGHALAGPTRAALMGPDKDHPAPNRRRVADPGPEGSTL